MFGVRPALACAGPRVLPLDAGSTLSLTSHTGSRFGFVRVLSHYGSTPKTRPACRPNGMAEMYVDISYGLGWLLNVLCSKVGHFDVSPCAAANLVSCRMGAMMGAGVGLTIGFIFGSYTIMRCALILTPSRLPWRPC